MKMLIVFMIIGGLIGTYVLENFVVGPIIGVVGGFLLWRGSIYMTYILKSRNISCQQWKKDLKSLAQKIFSVLRIRH